MAKADKALYESKHTGKNRVTLYHEDLSNHPVSDGAEA
jgi:hypothetical protein